MKLPSLNVMFSLVAETQSHLVRELLNRGKQSWNESIWLPPESIMIPNYDAKSEGSSSTEVMPLDTEHSVCVSKHR